MPAPRQWLRVLPFFVLFLVSGVTSFAQSQPSGDEKYLFDAVNRERAQRGAKPLKWDPALADAAQRHALEMVKHNAISHRFAGEAELKDRVSAVGARFSVVAENVAEASEVSQLHVNWMLSPGHAANILNPQLTAIGIAVERSGDELFAVQDFSAQVASWSKEEQEKRVADLIASHGIKISRDPTAARKACVQGSAGGGPRPHAYAEFESTDLSTLPDGLLKMIRSGSYSTAAVGACDPGDKGGFSMFRVAVLLF